MGYRVRPKTYRLKFRDPEFNGLEVDIRSMSVGEWQDMLTPSGDTGDSAAKNDATLALFADRLVSWNLEDDDGQPVPATLETLKGLDRPFVLELVAAWQLALLGVDPTSDGGSPSGETPAEIPRMPQEPLTAEDLEALSSPGRPGPMM